MKHKKKELRIFHYIQALLLVIHRLNVNNLTTDI